jgi:hypothetical protein
MVYFSKGQQLLILLICYFLQIAKLSTQTKSISTPNEGQLLDCSTIKSTGSNRNQSNCDNAHTDINTTFPTSDEPITYSPAYVFSIDFNNILKKRQATQNNENCTNDHQQVTDVICAPKTTNELKNKAIAVTLYSINNGHPITDTDTQYLKPDTVNAIRCQFRLLQSSNVTELDFKLRWLRSVVSQQGLKNQSISSDEIRNNQHDHQQILVSMNRVWTAQREGGLELLLDDVKPSDSGDYFCQAISSDETILDEKRVHLEIADDAKESDSNTSNAKYSSQNYNDASSFYSMGNMEKLLPSLHIIPDYSELAFGETIQLACVTRGLDPDPDSEKIKWTFESFERPGYVTSGTLKFQTIGLNTSALPTNTSQMGNILIVWFMSYETVGIYKCSYHLEDHNLTAEASAELTLRPSDDSAPIVFMTPELIRLSVKGSGRIQCESTGYPPPTLEWYRVDLSNVSVSSTNSDEKNLTQLTESGENVPSDSIYNLEGASVHQLRSQDVMAYCLESGCRALDNLDSKARKHEQHKDEIKIKNLVTGLSWLQIDQAQAHHQGQYVCKAINKHGSNQASSIIDVEFKEMPKVEIPPKQRYQTIVLDDASTPEQPIPMHSVTFNCSIKAGQPKPKLRWLRTNWQQTLNKNQSIDHYGAANLLAGHDSSRSGPSARGSSDLEIYDLTKVSSATARVSTWFDDFGQTLVLQLSTISIDDDGDYVCLGENELGRHSAVAHLVVRKPPQVRILQASPMVFRPNDSFQLDCMVSGHPPPVDIEWSRSDKGAFFALISRQSTTMSVNQERAVLKFDRVTPEESGEYTCAARDPIDHTVILKDTIMLLADENPASTRGQDLHGADISRQMPKLLVRPTKVSAELGSNLTLDCLAIAGLQPTVVEWLAPSTSLTFQSSGQSNEQTLIRPYYRSRMVSLAQDGQHSSLLQFGSRLRLFNVSKAHEGVYQCKGRNRVGTENAPAFVEVLDMADFKLVNQKEDTYKIGSNTTKTKIAKMGTNIELRCQVNGIDEQPATSWSREDRELPESSVQIDHNLWIQNLTKADEGLYLCSARSNEPNKILQARIRLLVNEDGISGKNSANGRSNSASYNAKIIASKTHLIEGDSVTLECVINFNDNTTDASSSSNNDLALGQSRSSSRDLAEIERRVIWTNLHSGQSLFQDNVYIQNNLLIIYNLKKENAAIYRCNYNDFSQHTDYKLQVGSSENPTTNSSSTGNSHNTTSYVTRPKQEQIEPISNSSLLNITDFLHNAFQIKHIVAPIGSRKVLECGSQAIEGRYFWTRDRASPAFAQTNNATFIAKRVGNEMEQLLLDPIDTSHAGLYQCNRPVSPNSTHYKIESQILVEVPVVAAKFVQRPVSFVTLPAVSDADHRLELEMKFYPENEHGLMLFSGGVLNNVITNQQPTFESSNSSTYHYTNNKTASSITNADYISLGLVRGYLEFRFELGDGVSLVRSSQPLELNRWHKVIIERNRRTATIWLDGQAPSSNSSVGKFFNLDLDSLLYVGGHQMFLNTGGNHGNMRQSSNKKHNINNQPERMNGTNPSRSFYGFLRGFKGCISSLKINQREINLMARNRSVTVGIFECDKSECPSAKSETKTNRFECPRSRGLCQVDRTFFSTIQAASSTISAKQQLSNPMADLRCICFPSYSGVACNESVQQSMEAHVPIEPVGPPGTSRPVLQSNKEKSNSTQSACNFSNQCNMDGTSQCEPLSSSSYKCHCKIGFVGEYCNHAVTYANETSVGLNQSAFIQFTFNPAREVFMTATHQPSIDMPRALALNETEYTRLITFTEQQNISFRVQTRASYGLLFYISQDVNSNEISSSRMDAGGFQASKSIVANILARLSATKVSDFLAVSLVDGHIELSYELGSGLAILRSPKRYNDGEWHKIQVIRSGKTGMLIIDDATKHETQSPGKLSMLNVGQDIYLGGLPAALQTLLSSSSSIGSLLSTFSGCLSDLQINSLGPINLVRSDHLTKMKSARNLAPCSDSLLSSSQTSGPLMAGDKISIDQMVIKSAKTSVTAPTTITTTTQAPLAFKRTTKKPTKPSYTTESDADDSDELARSS